MSKRRKTVDLFNLNYVLCPHCNEKVSKSTYYRHKIDYMNETYWNNKNKNPNLDEMKSAGSSTPQQYFDQDFGEISSNSENEEYVENELHHQDNENDDSDLEVFLNENSEDEEEFLAITSQNEPSETYNKDGKKLHPMILFFLHFLITWQSKFFISDKAIEVLLNGIQKIIQFIRVLMPFTLFDELVDQFPGTMYRVRSILNILNEKFLRYTVCPTCSQLYTFEDSIKNDIFGNKISQSCCNVSYPNHPINSLRKKCGTVLMKTIVSANGEKSFLHPKRIFCYKPISESLQQLINRGSFVEMLVNTTFHNEQGTLFDIWDGKIWQTFKDDKNELYFKNKRNLGVMLNVDWFQPFKNSEHSEGVIYLSILNLPLHQRIKWENNLVVGVIPGPSEPTLNINSFLRPIVEELMDLWKNGVMLEEKGFQALYKVALICVSADLPAIRKCCGFLYFNAKKGCSKCKNEFTRKTFGDKPDYSGTNVASWVKRNGDEHKKQAKETLLEKTASSRKALESTYGVRYSELFRLDYFDPIRCHAIDPMHNLLLGVTKYTFTCWIEKGVLSENDLQQINEKIGSMRLPPDLNRVFRNMSTCYKSLKAEEWKHWILNYSSYCLFDILPKDHFLMWKIFVSACNLLLKRSIIVNDIEQSHTLLILFCEKYTILFGKESWTPNMHMQLHLKDCLYDMGPVYGWWCMSFERFNGILGSFHTNNRNISVQLMNKFVNNATISTTFMEMQKTVGIEIISDCNGDVINGENYKNLHTFQKLERIEWECLTNLECVSLLGNPKLTGLDTEAEQLIITLFTRMGLRNISRISKFVKYYSKIKIGSEIVTDSRYRNGTSGSCQVIARYFGKEMNFENKNLRPGKIKQILQVILEVGFDDEVEKREVIVAWMEWYEKHEDENFLGYSCLVKIYGDLEMEFDNGSIIPIEFIEKDAL